MAPATCSASTFFESSTAQAVVSITEARQKTWSLTHEQQLRWWWCTGFFEIMGFKPLDPDA